MARSLDCHSQRSLVLGACSGLPPGFDLPTIGHVATHPADILVVDILDLVHAEIANFAAWIVPTTTSAATKSAAWTIV